MPNNSGLPNVSQPAPRPLIKYALTLPRTLRIQNAANGVDGVKLMKGEVDHAGRLNQAAFLRQKRSNIPVDHVNLPFYPSRRCLIALR